MHKILGMGMVAGSLALAAPVPAQTPDLGTAITDIATSMLQQEMDRTAFAAARTANTVQAYRDYLAKFPRGLHRADAERALQNLGAGSGDGAAAQAADRRDFAEAQRLHTVIAYRDYLARHPRGMFRADAELAIDQLNGTVTRPSPQPKPSTPALDTAPGEENSLGLTRNERREVQRQLTALGYNTRGADGAWGRNTRTAIANWQRDNRMPVTGYVTADQLKLIASQAGQASPNLPGPPNALPTLPQDAEKDERAIGLSIAERREIQLRLTLLGYDTQGTNGDFGRATRTALGAWQRSQGQAETGYITRDQLRALQRQTRG